MNVFADLSDLTPDPSPIIRRGEKTIASPIIRRGECFITYSEIWNNISWITSGIALVMTLMCYLLIKPHPNPSHILRKGNFISRIPHLTSKGKTYFIFQVLYQKNQAEPVLPVQTFLAEAYIPPALLPAAYSLPY